MTEALFERDGAHLVPTSIARGPWRPNALHGGAVAALLASAVDLPGRTPTRITFDLLGPVPKAPLTLLVSAPTGGERVARQTITLLSAGTAVAHAQCVAVRQTDLELQASAGEEIDPFASLPVPEMTKARPGVAERIGWECFDSSAISVRGLGSHDGPHNAVGLYVSLLVPVIADEITPPIARVAAAADYASNAVSKRLSFDRWSFMNAELTVHTSRPMSGTWIGLLSTAVLGPVGCGFSAAPLYDEAGRLGLASQALVVEERVRDQLGEPRATEEIKA